MTHLSINEKLKKYTQLSEIERSYDFMLAVIDDNLVIANGRNSKKCSNG